jgi:hypothetical protein
MNNPEHAKKHHLGYRGMERLVKGAKPGITILGECWPGIADLRIWLTLGLRKLCDTERIIPASLGLQLNPKDRKDIKLRCTNCKNYLSFDEVVVTSPSRPFDRLGFLCKRCRA